MGPGFSLMDWKDQILTWLPFILIADSVEDFSIDEAFLEAKVEMEEEEEDQDQGQDQDPDPEGENHDRSVENIPVPKPYIPVLHST